jgi:hypothetical protein
MLWTAANQQAAQTKLSEFSSEFNTAVEAWRNAVQSGAPGQTEAATQDVLRRWREYIELLKVQSDGAVANEGIMDGLSTLVDQLNQEKSVLAKLQSEAGTRTDQADTVNPKVRNSPYINILGLQRLFRSSTRTSILIAAIIFAVLAIAVIGFLVYRVVVTGQVYVPGYQMGGFHELNPKRAG